MSQTPFASPLNGISLTLALPYVAGSGTLTLASGSAAQINAELARQGLPSISASAPLRFTLASAASVAQFSLTSPALGPVFTATGLSGETLSGVTAAEGTTDANFSAGDSLLVLLTAAQVVAIQTAVNNLENGTTAIPIKDSGGQVYNVLAHGLVADGLIFTANGTATSAALTVFGVVPSSANVGNKITVVGAGTAGAVLATTISAVASTNLIGSITASTNTLTVTTSPGSPAAGTPVVIRGAGNSGADLYTTVSSVAGNTITLANNATTTVAAAAVVLNAQITLATPVVTSVTGASARCGTDNWQALFNLAVAVRPNPATLRFPTLFFPPGVFLFDLSVNTAANVGGVTISGAGLMSQLAMFDGPTVNAKYLFSTSHKTVFRDLMVDFGTNPNADTVVTGLLASTSPVGAGNGSVVQCFNVTSTGGSSTLFNLQHDDDFETHGCDFGAIQTLFHSGANSAGASQGRVRMFGGSVSGWGVNGSGQDHGLYIRNGVNAYISGVRFYGQTAGSTGFGIQFDNGAGTALEQVVIGCKFDSTVINGLIGADTGTTQIIGCAFECSGNAIRCAARTVVDSTIFRNTGAAAIIDNPGDTANTIIARNSEFYDNQLAVSTATSGWSVTLDRCYFTQRSSANAVSLTTPTATIIRDCWFSDGGYYGRLPAASLTNTFAALAGAGSHWYDTTNSLEKTSDGTTWQTVLNASNGLQKANNLSDVTAATARTNLGLGTAATQSTATFAQVANNLSDLANAGTARTNLGLGTAAVQSTTTFAQVANNLSDLANAGTARTNLGLGTAATQAATAFAQVQYIQAASVSDTTTGQQSLTSGAAASVGSLSLGANRLAVGTTVRVRAGGLLTSTGTPGTLRIDFTIGGTPVASSGAATMVANLTNKQWYIDFTATCTATGVSGSVIATGTQSLASNTGSNAVGVTGQALAAATINTTGTLALDVTATFGSSGQSITMQNCTIEILN